HTPIITATTATQTTNARCLQLIVLLAPNLTLKPPKNVRLKRSTTHGSPVALPFLAVLRRPQFVVRLRFILEPHKKRNFVIPSEARGFCGRSRGICFFLFRSFLHILCAPASVLSLLYLSAFFFSAAYRSPCFHTHPNTSLYNPFLL